MSVSASASGGVHGSLRRGLSPASSSDVSANVYFTVFYSVISEYSAMVIITTYPKFQSTIQYAHFLNVASVTVLFHPQSLNDNL